MTHRGARPPQRQPGRDGPDRPDRPLLPPVLDESPALLPLYREARETRPVLPVQGDVWGGNAGLWWSKLCDRWQPDFAELAEVQLRAAGQGQAKETRPGKADWILSLVHPRDATGRVDPSRRVLTGERELLKEHAARQEALAGTLGGARQVLRLAAPFVTGTGLDHPTENGFLFHHTLGVPYLPGTGVKGLVRAWAEQVEEADRALAERIFGRSSGEEGTVGSVIFLDALPVEPVQLTMEVMTPHYAEWYQASDPAAKPPADWYDPTPIPFLAVEKGASFAFALLPRPGAPTGAADVMVASGWLTSALEWLGAGAKTAIGFGRFGAPRQAPSRQPSRAVAAAPEARFFVEGEPVTILGQDGDLVRVQFANSDIEPVPAASIERR